jgi:TrmH family RNA methyltransferase
MDLGRIRVILVRPRNSGNVGAAARALKNMGLGRLVLVAPHRFDQARAAEMAVHAAGLVDHRSTVNTLGEAVADCGLVVGTTSRPSAVGRGTLTPRAAAREITAASLLNDVALLFGPEDHGLSTDELKLCHRVASIPASGEYASLNLAQAVLLFAYEVFLAGGDGHSGGERVLAPGERTELMYTKLEEAFRAVGFLHAGNVEHMMRTIRRILGRSGLSEHDVRVFLALARRVRWAGSRPAGSEPHRLRAAGCRGQRDAKVDTSGCGR